MQNKKNFKKINSCRLCSSTSLKEFISFGDLPLGNNLLHTKEEAINADKYPLVVNKCTDCYHFQLGHSINPKNLYATNYTYLSSIGDSFVNHMREYAEWVNHKFNLCPDSLVIDIGSNDGLGLKFFKDLGAKVLGVDPAKFASDIANKNNIPTINSFFTKEVVQEILKKYGHADFITSHNVFAHIDNLHDAFKNVHKLLKNSGIFIFEIGYFKNVLEKGFFDTIYHEHLDYHHSAPLINHLQSLGFEIINISTNSVQGGTLRIETRKSNLNIISQDSKNFLAEEKKSIIYDPEFLNNWKENIKINMEILSNNIKKHLENGLKIAGYGAPTKATLLLSLSKLSEDHIPFIFEDNNLKVGRFLPSTGIPIISTKELEFIKPDVIIIFAWNFSDNIILKLKNKINWDLKCIIPLPGYKEINI